MPARRLRFYWAVERVGVQIGEEQSRQHASSLLLPRGRREETASVSYLHLLTLVLDGGRASLLTGKKPVVPLPDRKISTWPPAQERNKALSVVGWL